MDDLSQSPLFWLVSFALYLLVVGLLSLVLKKQHGFTDAQLIKFVAVMLIGFGVVYVLNSYFGFKIGL